MNHSSQKILVLFSFGLLSVLSSAQNCPTYEYTTITDSAINATGLDAIVAQFKELLGGENNGNAPGPIVGGHRSINWDAPIVPFAMPFDFFNDRVPRGAVFYSAGINTVNEFRVSNPVEMATEPVEVMTEPVESPEDSNDVVSSAQDDKFDSILPAEVSAQFKTFSPERLFTPLNSRVLTASFRIPGSATSASVSGFGAVFTDVDQKYVTKMMYYDKAGCLIASVDVPAWDGGLSFAGIVLYDASKTERIAAIDTVDIVLGDVAMSKFDDGWGAEGRTGRDIVVLDDLIYGEPTVVA